MRYDAIGCRLQADKELAALFEARSLIHVGRNGGIRFAHFLLYVSCGIARRFRTSPTARCASRMAASVCGLAAASALAIVINPKGWRAMTQGRLWLLVNTHSIGSYRLL